MVFWAEFRSVNFRLFDDFKAPFPVHYICKKAQKLSQRRLKGLFLIILASQYSSFKVDLQAPLLGPKNFSKQTEKKPSSRRLGKTFFRRRKDAFVSAGTISFIKKDIIMQPTLIKFIILCLLSLVILFVRFLFYLAVLYLFSVFLVSNMNRFGSVFDVNVSYIVKEDFNDIRSFLISSYNSVHVYVYVNGENYLNHKHVYSFQSKTECDSNNFKLEVLFLETQSWIKDENIWMSYIGFNAQCYQTLQTFRGLWQYQDFNWT